MDVDFLDDRKEKLFDAPEFSNKSGGSLLVTHYVLQLPHSGEDLEVPHLLPGLLEGTSSTPNDPKVSFVVSGTPTGGTLAWATLHVASGAAHVPS